MCDADEVPKMVRRDGNDVYLGMALWAPNDRMRRAQVSTKLSSEWRGRNRWLPSRLDMYCICGGALGQLGCFAVHVVARRKRCGSYAATTSGKWSTVCVPFNLPPH